jgi:transcriptional regulator with XRE-family HTH domain
MNVIGTNIRLYREKNSLTQKAVADYLDISRELISYYETGERNPQIEVLTKLSDLFGIELEDLLEESEEITQEKLVLAFRNKVFTNDYIHEFIGIVKEGFYDDTFTDSIIDFETGKNSTEKSADLFASFLLLPEGLIEIIPEAELSKNKITIPSIVKIEQYYRCSRQALLIRLKGLNLIDKKYMEKLGIDVINQVKILGYDTSLYQPGNNNRVIGSYALYAKKLYDNDIISESNFIDLLLDSGIDPVGLDLNVSIG